MSWDGVNTNVTDDEILDRVVLSGVDDVPSSGPLPSACADGVLILSCRPLSV